MHGGLRKTLKHMDLTVIHVCFKQRVIQSTVFGG
jgi:hypothetical protein